MFCFSSTLPIPYDTEPSITISSDLILRKGLEIVGFDARRQRGVSMKTNILHFKQAYGSHPAVYARIWHDLQTTTEPAAIVDSKHMNLHYFLMTLHFLKTYKSEGELAGTFKVSEATAGNWIWFFAAKIQGLKSHMIRWPTDLLVNNNASPVFLISVDGVHCRINEPKHPVYSKNKEYYSHKFNSAGLSYEIGIEIFRDRVAWINGPFKAGKSDMSIFRENLMVKLLESNKKAIGDKGML